CLSKSSAGMAITPHPHIHRRVSKKAFGVLSRLSLQDERNDLARGRRLSVVHLAVASDHRRIAGGNQTGKQGSGLRNSGVARATDDKTAVRVEDRRHLGGRPEAYRC